MGLTDMKHSLLATTTLGALGLTAAVLLSSGEGTQVTASAAPGTGALFTGSMGAKVFLAADNDTPSNVVDLASNGIYAPASYGWAVVFDWTTVHVEPGAVVRFLNHPSGAPVIWHATGDILIEGEVNLNGERGHHVSEVPRIAEPGPGGFRGGRASYYTNGGSGAGFGPGGGYLDGEATGHYDVGGAAGHRDAPEGYTPHGASYGGAGLFPLVGGSGGAAGASFDWWGPGGGGAGGGAILIASDATLTVANTGSVLAEGGAPGSGSHGSSGRYNSGGGGSGGAIRLVGDSVHLLGFATLSADRGYGSGLQGSVGRVRIEANSRVDASSLVIEGRIRPEPSVVEQTYEIIPSASPELRIVAYDPDGIAGPEEFVDITSSTIDPDASLFPPSTADVSVPSAGTIALRIQATSSLDGESVEVRVVRARGQAVLYDSSPLVSSGPWAEAVVEIDLEGGVSSIQLRVDLND